VTRETVQFETETGVTLVGTPYRPEGGDWSDQAPGLLAVHGYTGSRETVSPFAVELARLAFVTVVSTVRFERTERLWSGAVVVALLLVWQFVGGGPVHVALRGLQDGCGTAMAVPPAPNHGRLSRRITIVKP
jgi:hypothetical protein